MRLALGQGRRALGRTWPNPSVGAVVFRGRGAIGVGRTAPPPGPHAEVVALRSAQRKGGAVLPLPRSLKTKGAAATRVLKSLIKKGLLAEKPAARDAAAWRTGEDGRRRTLVVSLPTPSTSARSRTRANSMTGSTRPLSQTIFGKGFKVNCATTSAAPKNLQPNTRACWPDGSKRPTGRN